LIDKVRDIVGLYMNPPQDALVLCVDEKSQVQALSRRQPILPLRPGQLERRFRQSWTSIWFWTHKTVRVRRRLQKRPRYHLPFTPTHASWLNQVERWFALLTQRQIKRGSHARVELQDAVSEFIAVHNQNPKPFVWTKKADQIWLRSPVSLPRRWLHTAQTVMQEINDSGD
jgi:hypothetical protein